MTKRSFISSSPKIVENVLRGVVDSMAFIAQPENKPAVLKAFDIIEDFPSILRPSKHFEPFSPAC